MVAFALESGQRLDNVRSLRWKQIDWKRRTITFHIKSRKPGGRHHVIPLTEPMTAVLSVERGRHPEFVFTYAAAAGGAGRYWSMVEGVKVAIERKAGQRYPWSRYGWRKPWLAALEAVGLTEARFHDLRHTAATRLQAQTGNIKLVARLLGHASVTTTTRYLKADVEELRAAMEPNAAPAKKEGLSPKSSPNEARTAEK